MLNSVKHYEEEAMRTAMNKIADGTPRTAAQIAGLTGLTKMEVRMNMEHLEGKPGYSNSRFNRLIDDENGVITESSGLFKRNFKFSHFTKESERQFVELDENGEIIPGSLKAVKSYTTYYVVMKIK